MKTAVVCGASGLIGAHMVARLQKEKYLVREISRHRLEQGFGLGYGEHYPIDLRYLKAIDPVFHYVDEVYQFACEVGGLGYIANSANDADCLRNSTLIDINVLEACRKNNVGKVFFASSACVYPPTERPFKERYAYPALATNEFAWQKLFAERLYQSYARNYGMDIKIGRLFNTYGPGMAWQEPRAKSVAALCRKIAEAPDGGTIEVWGDGTQKRSYTYVDDIVEGIWRLMQLKISEPVNIGYEKFNTVEQLGLRIAEVANKFVRFKFVEGPVGVRQIVADCTKLRDLTDWVPKTTLLQGLEKTYPWVKKQVALQAELV